MQHGHWLVVLNCHMDLRWCSEAMAWIDEAEMAAVHVNFRPWFCTRTNCLDDIPLSLLNRLSLVAVEPSMGLTNAMIQSFASVAGDPFTGCEQLLDLKKPFFRIY